MLIFCKFVLRKQAFGGNVVFLRILRFAGADTMVVYVGASGARPLPQSNIVPADGQHPRVVSLAIRAIHLLAAPTFSNDVLSKHKVRGGS